MSGTILWWLIIGGLFLYLMRHGGCCSHGGHGKHDRSENGEKGHSHGAPARSQGGARHASGSHH